MKQLLLIALTIFLNTTGFAQFGCDDLFYNEDSVIMVNDEPYTGYCDFVDKNGKLESRFYHSYGELDSIAFYRPNGLMQYMEPYLTEQSMTLPGGSIKKAYYGKREPSGTEKKRACTANMKGRESSVMKGITGATEN